MRLPAPGLRPAHTPLPRGASDDGGAFAPTFAGPTVATPTRAADRGRVVAVVVVSLAFVQAQAKDVPGVGVWVVERSNAPLLGKAAGGLAEAVASAVGAGASAVSVRVVVSGKVHDVLTNAGTVGELLSAMGIHPDADDRVVPSPSTPLHVGDPIQVDRVDIRRPDAPSVRSRSRSTTDYSTDVGIGRHARRVAGVRPGASSGSSSSGGQRRGRRDAGRVLHARHVARRRVPARGSGGADGGSITVPGVGGRDAVRAWPRGTTRRGAA